MQRNVDFSVGNFLFVFVISNACLSSLLNVELNLIARVRVSIRVHKNRRRPLFQVERATHSTVDDREKKREQKQRVSARKK